MDKQIISYKIIDVTDIDNLCEIVMEYIVEGWELYGSPFYAYSRYCQAIVLYS